ncbi:hypothetical protein FRACA_540004 [Frankia canadensis]|uniref:Uncharacterized protein n=1 Tax=Frankia canadensis TaxID=1836972 RepID=A0A2I2KYT5_9ACTN|nr:hypothetical protein [Frankia canadensis]SNQ50818.1 hypothetical protein FRACA_540004 [Frankia canadensis]SOU58108.1 hypothetical protein FRACA_540004 [Frankia canadensis]
MSPDFLQTRLLTQLTRVTGKKDRALGIGAPDRRRELLTAALAECDTIAAQLAAPGAPAPLVKAPLLRLDGEIRAHLGHLDLAMLTLGRSAALLHTDGVPLFPEPAAAAFLHLGRCYRQLGDASTAIRMFEAAARTTRRSRDSQYVVALMLTCVEADRRPELAACLDALEVKPAVLKPPDRAVYRLCAYLDGRADLSLRELRRLEKQCAVRRPGDAERSVLAASAYLHRMRWHPGDADDALDCLRRAADAAALAARGFDPYTVACARRLAAEGLMLAGRREEALGAALESWAATQRNAARTSSGRLRVSARALGDRAVAIALDCAASQRDWRLQAELLATLHLERQPGRSAAPRDVICAAAPLGPELAGLDIVSVAAPDLCLAAHRDVVDAWSVPPAIPRVSVEGRCALADAERASGGTHGGPDRSTVVGLEQLHRQVAGGRRETCWWLSWVSGASVFSTVLPDGRPPAGERVDLADDQELRHALSALAHCVGITPLTTSQEPPISTRTTFTSLRSHDSLEELEVTRPLAALVPATLVTRLTDDATRPVLDVLACIAPELSGVPWPIVPLRPGPQATRLVERCTLRVLVPTGPQGIAEPGPGAEWRAGAGPFRRGGRTSCSDPTGQLRWTPVLASDICPGRQPPAGTLGGASPARYIQVEEFLARYQPASPGTLLLRGVAHWDGPDMTRHGLRFPAGAVLEARRFRGPTSDAAWLRCPAHVLLSTRQPATFPIVRGGESVQYAGALLTAGARTVVFTAADVADSSFAHAVDLDIEANLADTEDPARWLRDYQLRLLHQWRHFSLTMEHEPEDIRSPLPLIWAYYQAAQGVAWPPES